MKVKELIKELEKYNGNLEVKTCEDGMMLCSIDKVERGVKSVEIHS